MAGCIPPSGGIWTRTCGNGSRSVGFAAIFSRAGRLAGGRSEYQSWGGGCSCFEQYGFAIRKIILVADLQQLPAIIELLIKLAFGLKSFGSNSAHVHCKGG
jgi:hypothetical protein